MVRDRPPDSGNKSGESYAPAVTLRGLVVLGAAMMVAGAACGSTAASQSSSSVPVTTRPATRATLAISSPAPNAVTGRDVRVVMRLDGAHLVPPTQVGGRLFPDRGHIHVSVDGVLVAMPVQLVDSLPVLSPGTHTVEVEFVASDHLPFQNRVVAAVTFRVK
jgi:hypothetical protein